MGWEAAYDPVKRKWFYQDIEEGISCWQRPAGCNFSLPQAPPADAPLIPSHSVEGLPVGWQVSWDCTSRQYYYYNHITKERSWERPPSSARPPPQAAALPSQALVSPTYFPGRAPNLGWDAAACLRRLAEAQSPGAGRYALRGVLKDVAESNYKLRNQWPVPRTLLTTLDHCMRAGMPRPAAAGSSVEVSFSGMTTADAILCLAAQGPGTQICALNFANGVQVGGGYKTGAMAQEEDLCRRFPSLYTSLNNAQRDGLYPFGPSTCTSRAHPARYAAVLWTPSVMLARAGERDGFALLPEAQQQPVSLVAAAAPNLRFAKPPELKDRDLMYETVRAVLVAPRVLQPGITTLVLGAWGCGAFGGDPAEISELFCEALGTEGLGRLYREVHFAVPRGGDGNADIFLGTLRRYFPKCRELDRPEPHLL